MSKTKCQVCNEQGWRLTFVPEAEKFMCPDCAEEFSELYEAAKPQECPECGDQRKPSSYGPCKKCGYHS